MDNNNLHHLAEAILSAVNDKNYNAARDLTHELFNALSEMVVDNWMTEKYGEDWRSQ